MWKNQTRPIWIQITIISILNPDGLRTPENNECLKNLMDTPEAYLQAIDNQMVPQLSQEEFVEKWKLVYLTMGFDAEPIFS